MDQFAGAWAMKTDRANALAREMRRFDLNKHVESQAAFIIEESSEERKPYAVSGDGIAQISVKGVITKYGSSFTGPGSVQTRKALRDAAADQSVRGILMTIDSPGGTVAGTGDLADDINKVGKSKPIVAYVEDLAASAAYWIASQAGRIVASPNSEIGSIGTYARIEDWSKAFADAGCKVHVIKAGEFKGAGEPGTEITDAQLAEWQNEINGINELFINAVTRGRGRDATDWADGRVRRADRALKSGMIDAVGTFDVAMQEIRNMLNDQTRAEDMPMDEEKDEETPTEGESIDEAAPTEEEEKDADAKAASISELRALGPADFALACVEAGLTVNQAKVIAAADAGQAKEIDTLKAQVARLMAGQEPVTVAPPTGEQVASVDKIEQQMKAEWAKGERKLRAEGFKSYEQYEAIRVRELTGKERS